MNTRFMLRLEERMKDLMEARAKQHGVSTSEYLRGLVAMEALLGGSQMDPRDVPEFMLKAYPIGFLKEARKRLPKHKTVPLMIRLEG